MKIFHLLCFVTLCRASTFSEAAEKLYISQSSFSNNIQTLERELGARLVTRGTRAFSLTEAGRAFLVYAEKIVKEYDRMKALLQDYKQSAENRVLVFADPLSSYGYNPTLANFKRRFPDIQTEVAELSEERFDDILKIRKDAVGILFSTSKAAPAGTKSHTLISDRLVAFLSDSHRLAGRKRLRLHELKDEVLQIIASRQSRFLNEFVLDQCHKAGFEPNVARFDLWYGTMRETMRGLGVPSIIPEMAAHIFCQEDLRVIGLDTDDFYINVVISEECTNRAALQFFQFAQTAEKAPPENEHF